MSYCIDPVSLALSDYLKEYIITADAAAADTDNVGLLT